MVYYNLEYDLIFRAKTNSATTLEVQVYPVSNYLLAAMKQFYLEPVSAVTNTLIVAEYWYEVIFISML